MELTKRQDDIVAEIKDAIKNNDQDKFSHWFRILLIEFSEWFFINYFSSNPDSTALKVITKSFFDAENNSKDNEEKILKFLPQIIKETNSLFALKIYWKENCDLITLKNFITDIDNAYRNLEYFLNTEVHKFEKKPNKQTSLFLNRVQISSPGFWEFLGSLNPLQQIREYLKDRHERKKDRKYKEKYEEETLYWKNLQEQNTAISTTIDTLKKLGYSKEEIRKKIEENVMKPLKKLDKYQDNNNITTAEIE